MKAAGPRADLVLILHLAAAAFGLLGGLMVLRHQAWAWVHVPVALWFVVVNLADWTCPLTTLERSWREGARGAYGGGFVEHYVGRLAPGGWTRRRLESGVGLVFLAWNAAVYAWVLGTPP